MITLNEISLQYDKTEDFALSDVNVHIDKGEFVFIVGKSGAGKSSLIKLILKELEPTSGKIAVAGKNLTALKKREVPFYRRNVGVVFQNYRLIESKTVYENVAFAMEVLQIPSAVIKKTVPKILNMVGLRAKSRKAPSHLSGGEQQRVAIARAIINQPKILICDEPTGNLDPNTSLGIMKLLMDINRMGTTVLIATHDITMVNKLQKRVLVLNNGQLVSDKIGGYYD